MIKSWKMFNESKIDDMVKSLDQSVTLNVVTETNPVEHRILLANFMDYAWSHGFDKEGRLFFGGPEEDEGNPDQVSLYVTKDDIRSLMTEEEKKIEKTCHAIQDLMNDALIDIQDSVNVSLSLNSYEYKMYDLATTFIGPKYYVSNTYLSDTIIEKARMFAELISDEYKVFNVVLHVVRPMDPTKTSAMVLSPEEFQTVPLTNVINIQINTILKQKIFGVKK